MNPWLFILGAYLVTAIVVVAEIVALRMRYRAAVAALHDGTDAGGDTLGRPPLHSNPF